MAAFADSLLHGFQIVPGLQFFLFQVDFRTAGNGKYRLVQHRIASKDPVNKLLNNIFQQDKFRLFLRKVYYPAQAVRQRNNAEDKLFLSLQYSRNIKLLVVQMWERMMLVNNLGSQYRQDTLLEIGFQIAVLLLGQVTNIPVANSLFQQAAAEIVKNPVPLAIKLPHLVEDGMKLLPGSHVTFIVPFVGIHGLQA